MVARHPNVLTLRLMDIHGIGIALHVDDAYVADVVKDILLNGVEPPSNRPEPTTKYEQLKRRFADGLRAKVARELLKRGD